jgi:hypothetical protein
LVASDPIPGDMPPRERISAKADRGRDHVFVSATARGIPFHLVAFGSLG